MCPQCGHLHRRVDGLKGFPEAVEAVFPQATVQLCLVYRVRHSLNYVSLKRQPELVVDLKRIDTCATAEEAVLGTLGAWAILSLRAVR